MKTIQEVRDATFDDLCDKLLKYGMCMVVRPTGFGKTYMTTKLMSMYNKVLFLYPNNIIADVVRDTYKEEQDNIDYMSYAGLIRKNPMVMKDYELIVCDECHRLGADKTRDAIKSYLTTHRNCKFVGLTATPKRTDSYDVLSDLFNGVRVFPYTLHDAISDGFVAKPYYCYMSYDVYGDIRMSLEKGIKNLDLSIDEVIKKDLFSRNIENGIKVHQKDKVIKDVCNSCLKSTNYMKFMWFFPTKKALKEGYEEVIEDFHKAFPNHEIRELCVISEYEFAKNTAKLKELTKKDNCIDLIFSVDMLNMGYHVDNVTGVGLCRATDSSIIFTQQIGRCINTIDVDPNPKIIFDFVDNLSRRALYEVGTGRGRGVSNSLEEFKDILENSFNFEDVICVGHLATYEQFLKKVELEPKKACCRSAYWKWKNYGGGIDRPEVPIDTFAILYGVNTEDVLEEMGISDIYDEVDESTRVPLEILNLTGKYE